MKNGSFYLFHSKLFIALKDEKYGVVQQAQRLGVMAGLALRMTALC